jgi:hypothetical protein
MAIMAAASEMDDLEVIWAWIKWRREGKGKAAFTFFPIKDRADNLII